MEIRKWLENLKKEKKRKITENKRRESRGTKIFINDRSKHLKKSVNHRKKTAPLK